MITVQMNLILHCDNPKCNETKHFTGYLPIGAGVKEIFEEVDYQERWTTWRYRKSSNELFCSVYCEEEVHGEN